MEGRSFIMSFDFDGYFPAELWMEVFARLPMKTLLRLRCVSKTWRNIIDNPGFIYKHAIEYNKKNNPEKFHLLTLDKTTFRRFNISIRRTDTFRKSAQLSNISDPYYPWTGVDGLILTVSDSTGHMQLLNPSIRKSLQIPLCPLRLRSEVYGVGFAPSINDYKVVAFQPSQDRYFGRSGKVTRYEPAFAVYALNDGCLRKSTRGIDIFTWSIGTIQQHDCISTNGALYWIRFSYIEDFRRHRIVSFDLDTEEFRFLELPGDEGDMLRLLFLFGESVAVLGISPLHTCIWVMDKDGGKESWSLWYSGDSTVGGHTFLRRHVHGKLLFLEKSSVFLLSWCGKLMSYNFRSHEIRQVAKSTYVDDMYIHLESLLFSGGLRTQALTSFP